MELLNINKDEIFKMLEDLSFNILMQFEDKDMVELEKIKYTVKNLKKGIITKKISELLIDRANSMYDAIQNENKLLHWTIYIENSNSDILHIPIKLIKKEIRELLEKLYLTQDEYFKLKKLLQSSDLSSEDEEFEKNTIFPSNFNKRKVKIRVEGNIIKIISQYDIDVINIVKKLHYSWDYSQKTWKRTIDKFNGPLVDRVIEVASNFLIKGYAVKVPEEYLENIKKGEYSLEKTRWISYNSQQKMFVVWWEHNDKIKTIFKNIKSTFKNKKYYVEIQNYTEIFEFADIFNFSISEEAQRVAKQYQKEVEEKKIKLKIKVSSKIDKNLEEILTQGNEIIEDLKDE